MATETLRVFEVTVVSDVLVVDLPAEWAKECRDVRVDLRETDHLGWHLTLTGDGDTILTFPWHDRADELLVQDPSPFPTTAQDWDDLEQGWWGVVVRCRDLVYVAEVDFDALVATVEQDVSLVRPGLVKVGGVDVSWHSATADAYERAWANAIDRCRDGDPGCKR